MFKKRNPPTTGRTRVTQPIQRGPVFSYANSRSVRPGATVRNIDGREQQQEGMRRGPRLPWLKRIPVLGAWLAILVVAFAVLQLSRDVKVVTVGDSDGQVFLRDRAAYQAAANKAFTPLLNSNKLTVDAGAIAADLRRQFPELAVVSVSLPVVGSRPVVYIQPAAPRLILVSQSGMYVLDGNGRALVTGNQVSQLDALQIPAVTDESGLPISLGEPVLPKTAVSFIEEVVGQLRAKSIKVVSLTLPAGTNELHARIEGAGYFVKFNLQGKAREEVGSFIAVKRYMEVHGMSAGEYVDVRVENKAYFR